MDYAQFKGKPFQVVSKLGVRYTGIFDHISQEDQTICLSQVFNHGTEDRPSARKLPGSSSTLGWVRFHTESIDSLALVENYIAPGTTEEPIDPILASVSKTAPGATADTLDRPRAAGTSALPSKPTPPPSTSLEKVQQSLADLSTTSNGHPPRHANPRGDATTGYKPPRRTSRAAAIEVPDAEFDFSKGTQALQAEREARRAGPSRSAHEEDGEEESEDESLPTATPHPIAVQRQSSSGENGRNGDRKPQPAYSKNNGFFDQLSTATGKVSIAEERGRNYDTFGEAGGAEFVAGGRGGYGWRGGGGERGGYRGREGGYGRGGYQQGEGRGGYGGRAGYGGGGGGGGGGRGFDPSRTGSFEPNQPGYGGGDAGRGGYSNGGRSQDQAFRGRGGMQPGGTGGGYRGRGGWN